MNRMEGIEGHILHTSDISRPTEGKGDPLQDKQPDFEWLCSKRDGKNSFVGCDSQRYLESDSQP